MDDQTRLVLQNVATTYEGHVVSHRAYGWRPLDYDLWKNWHDADNARLGPPWPAPAPAPSPTPERSLLMHPSALPPDHDTVPGDPLWRADPGRCEEASFISHHFYTPCDKPATHLILMENGTRVYRMCASCRQHNLGRGGVTMEHFEQGVSRSNDPGEVGYRP